jgi:hypothetical protein
MLDPDVKPGGTVDGAWDLPPAIGPCKVLDVLGEGGMGRCSSPSNGNRSVGGSRSS